MATETSTPMHFPQTQTEAIDMMLSGFVAWDDSCEITLRRSRGHRKAGQKTRYTTHYGPYRDENNKGFFHLTATDDDEALEKANQRLQRLSIPDPSARSFTSRLREVE
jgi:acetyl-CoA carboxylase carboxyltransferase component